MSGDRIGFALLGCGRMGLHHGEHLLRDGRGRIVAIHDPAPAAMEALSRQLGVQPARCPTAEALFDHPGVAAVVINTPTGQHYQQALAALSRPLHVLCEKPLAQERFQILELMTAAEQARQQGRAIALGYQRRHWATFRTLRQIVLSGRYGGVRAAFVQAMENWQQTITGTWRDDPAQNRGGFVGDAGSHKLDTLFYVTGLSPVDVIARTQNCDNQVEIVAGALATLTGNIPMTLNFVGHAQSLHEDLHIHCDAADLMLRQNELWIGTGSRSERLPLTEPHSEPTWGLMDVIEGRTENLSPFAAALPVFDLTTAIRESARTAQPVPCGR